MPADYRVPRSCIDNASFSDGKGEMHWGDGTIRHGHYLVLLATEYALLKKEGQPLEGILNELYYALEAINRLDLYAESELDVIYNIDNYYGLDLNGFYLREDVPEDFCLFWQDEEMQMRCTNSAFYENNNVLKVHDPANNYITKPTTSHQNSPSLDQVTSLMVGLLMVHKLVDDIYVKPMPNDQGFYLVSEVKAIVNRMMEFYIDHEWQIIDVNGWPSPNGGADLILACVPFINAAEAITGINYA